MTKLDISRQLLEAGRALHGPQWKRPLARDLDVAESSVRDWANGRRAHRPMISNKGLPIF
jgi:hypothetical protein